MGCPICLFIPAGEVKKTGTDIYSKPSSARFFRECHMSQWKSKAKLHSDRSSRLSLPRKSSWNCSPLLHKPSVNLPLGWTLTYLGLWAISELGGERVTGEKKGMETNTLFSLLPRMDSNFILEEAKVKVLDYFRFSVARLITMEHLRIS